MSSQVHSSLESSCGHRVRAQRRLDSKISSKKTNHKTFVFLFFFWGGATIYVYICLYVYVYIHMYAYVICVWVLLESFFLSVSVDNTDLEKTDSGRYQKKQM